MNELFDVVVIGGGPAGSSLSICLRQHNLSVAMVERSDYEAWRPGEILDAECSPLLGRLGLDANKIISSVPHIPLQSIETAWGYPEAVERHSIFNPYGSGYLVDRTDFDAALAYEAERAGVHVYRKASFVSAIPSDGHSDLVVSREPGKYLKVKTKLLIDATGRMARVSRAMGGRLVFYDDLVAIAGLVSLGSIRKSPAESTITIEAAEDGWWYIATMPSHESVVAVYLTDSDIFLEAGARPALFWSSKLKGTEYISAFLGREHYSASRARFVVRSCRTSRLFPTFGKGWLAIGDAAFSVDPLSGGGVARAIESGIKSSIAIVSSFQDGESLRQYSDEVAYAFDRYVLQRRDYYGLERRWPESKFWSRRQQQLSTHANVSA